MNKILLDGGEKQFSIDDLPIIIQGEEGSGASLYTVSLSANFYHKGFTILFLCGFAMAEEEFRKQVGSDYAGKARFFTKEKVEEFKEILDSNNTDNTVIVVKNVELFGEDVISLLANKQNVIVSGDINESNFKNRILDKMFVTQIYFSPIEGVEFPVMNKYEGFVISDKYKGVTSLQAS